MVRMALVLILAATLWAGMKDPPALIETDTLRLLDSLQVCAGETISVPVYLKNTLAVVGFGLNIKYDSELQLVDVLPGSAIDSFWTNPFFGYDSSYIDTMVYVVAYTEGNAYENYFFPGSHVIAYLKMVVPTDAGSGTIYEITFYDDTSHIPTRYNVIVDTTFAGDLMPVKDNGSLVVTASDVTEISNESAISFDIQFIEGKAVLMFTLPESRYAEVKLYSVDGRCVAELFKGLLTEGATRIERNLSIPSGMYFVRALMGPDMITKKVIVLRGGGCIRGGEIRSKKGGGRGPEDNRMGLGVKTRRGKSCGKNEK